MSNLYLERNLRDFHGKDVVVTTESVVMALEDVALAEGSVGWLLKDGPYRFMVPSDCACMRSGMALVVYNQSGFMALIVEEDKV